ncbi:NUDIX domain-containing protein [Chungangia koreensis]|uniref:NUDIX domain-containing protein n=1 Tax=Chungangia koreensis TaxID=752657 RepID=A0ABV8X4U8_9LACT
MRNRSSVVIIENTHVLLIRREKNGEVYFVFPGGGIELGESPEEAAIREAYEELGVHVKLIGIVSKIQYNGMQYFFKAEILSGKIGTGKAEEFANPDRGSYEPMFVPIEQLDSIPVFPKNVVEKFN